MAIGMEVVMYATTGGTRVGGQANTYSSGQRVSIEESIPNGNDQLVAFALDVSQIKSIVISAPAVLVVNWSDAGGTDAVLTLVAGVPYIWTTDSYDALFSFANFPANNIAALHVDNATGNAVVLSIEVIIDPTL